MKISQFRSTDPNFLKNAHIGENNTRRKRHPHTIFSGMVKGRVIFYSIDWFNFIRHKSFFETFKCSIITIPTILNTLSYRPSTDRFHPYQDSWFPCLVRILIPMWIVDSKESSKLVKILSRMKERENED